MARGGPSGIVLVCGGRAYPDGDFLKEYLNVLHSGYDDNIQHNGSRGSSIKGIVHGCAGELDYEKQLVICGADEFAGEWARSVGVTEHRCPADWKAHGRAAGPIRNKAMLDRFSPNMVVAFPGGTGTGNMVKQARAAGVPVIQIVVTKKAPRASDPWS